MSDPSTTSNSANRTFQRKDSFPILTFALWLLLLYAGFKIAWNYSATHGQKTTPPRDFPEKSSVQLHSTGYSLILFAHPHCPYSDASVDEQDRLLARTAHSSSKESSNL